MAWRLRPPTRTDRWRIKGALSYTTTREVTIFGDDEELHISEEGGPYSGGTDQGSIPYGTVKYIWYGGHVNITDDPAIRDLWAANGFNYEEV